ncbi:MAG: alpha/beta hydrolase [Gemmatimonadota bacterium]
MPCTAANALCAERVPVGPSIFLPVFSTHSVLKGDTSVTRGLIVIHGTNRNADDYFESGFLAAAEAGELERTVVVAPHFQTRMDGPAEDEPYWTHQGWKRGNLSQSAPPSARRSSCAALDSVVAHLADRTRFPALTEIVVTGHSAGGQVVHRYAATSRVPERHPQHLFRYVVANPSTYLYVRPERAVADTFAVPDTTTCPDYDDWHYGLRNRNTYAGALEADSIVAQLVRRDVRILLGDADSLSANLDTSCGAMLQGPYRFARGRRLVRFMDVFFEARHHHKEMVVPGVGHSSRQMWLSEVGREALFGHGGAGSFEGDLQPFP